MEKLNLPIPKNQLQEVAWLLLRHPYGVSRRQSVIETGILNLSARIADLRLKYNVCIETKRIDVKNKFGRTISYGAYKAKDPDELKKLYLSLVSSE